MKAVSGPISRLLPGLAAAVFALLFLRTSGCRRYIPEVFGPQSTYQGAPTAFRFTIASARGNIDFVVDWGDGTSDTLWDHPPGDTVSTLHTWSDIGSYGIKAMAMLTGENHTYTEWSSPHEIEILPNDAPTAGFDAPFQARVDVEVEFTVWGTDPGGEDVSLKLRFGNEESDWTEYMPSGESVKIVHTFIEAGETLWASARARDVHGASGPWSDSATVITTDAGGMLWWVTDEDSLWPSTATVVVEYNGTEYVYFGTDDGYFRIYGVDFATGKSRISGTNLFPELENWGWSSHPAHNENTGHIVIAHRNGELHAFDRELNRIWTFPGAASPAYLTSTPWSHACISGNSIFVPNIDTIIRGGDTIDNVTKFYKIPDGPDRPVDPPSTVIGTQVVLGAPVADASGNVFFVTDSGYLFKMNSNIQVQWQKRITDRPYVYGPVVGAAGVVFCGDDEGKVYAFNPDGEKKWEQTLTGVREMYMVVGNQYLFAACDNGYVCALDPGTGSEVWDKRVSTAGGFVVYPVLTANRLMYVLDDNTKLFCIEQATGNKVWDIACTDYYRGRPGTDGVVDPEPSPTLLSNGNIIIVGEHAMYCVSGYKDGTLDTEAPWPKWQHDLHNTGNAVGW